MSRILKRRAQEAAASKAGKTKMRNQSTEQVKEKARSARVPMAGEHRQTTMFRFFGTVAKSSERSEEPVYSIRKKQNQPKRRNARNAACASGIFFFCGLTELLRFPPASPWGLW